MATIASLQTSVPGALTPSVQSKGVLRFAGRNLTISIVGIDPRTEIEVSNLATHMRQGTLNSLYRSSNAILLGDRLANKIGARGIRNVTLSSAEGASMSATVVGTFHSGFRATDETTGYVLLKTAQVLEKQTGIVNEIRVRTRDPMQARLISERIGEQTGYKSVSWQEAQEDLLSAITLRNVLMYTIVGAILLVASFGTYNIISTITHEKTRDIAILKSLGFRDYTIRAIFVAEALLVGTRGRGIRLGSRVSTHPWSGVAGVQDSIFRLQSFAGFVFREALLASRRRSIVIKPGGRLFSREISRAVAPSRHC